MRGLQVAPGRGIGGFVLERRRPYAVSDYVLATTTITHDYDNPVRREGIDEADRRIQLFETANHPHPAVEQRSVALDELRDLHAELRSIAHDVDDTGIRERLRRACERFTRLEQHGETPAEPTPTYAVPAANSAPATGTTPSPSPGTTAS